MVPIKEAVLGRVLDDVVREMIDRDLRGMHVHVEVAPLQVGR